MVVPVYFSEHLTQVNALAQLAKSTNVMMIAFCNSRCAYESATHPGLHAITYRQNVGYGPAANAVATSTYFDWLLLCNDDLQLQTEDFAALIHELKTLRSSDAWTIGLIDAQSNRLSKLPGPGSVFASISLLDSMRQRIRGKVRKPPRIQRPELGATAGIREVARGTSFPFVCVAISSAGWKDLAGFDSEFALYFEDMDYLRRASTFEHHRFAVFETTLMHQGSASTKKDLQRVLPVSVWSAYRYLVRHTGTTPAIAKLALCSALFLRFLLAPFSPQPLGAHIIGVVSSVRALMTNKRPTLPPWDSESSRI